MGATGCLSASVIPRFALAGKPPVAPDAPVAPGENRPEKQVRLQRFLAWSGLGSALSKGNIIIAAYRGTSATNPVASFSRQLITSNSATRTTPMATLGVTTWALSYWMHRDGTTTALTPPAGVASRSNGTQTGGGRVTTLLADSGASVNPGPYGGLTATAAAASSVATTWTIVLAPA